jgi:hypothetical protein
MTHALAAIALVWLVFYLIPFVVYAAFSAFGGLRAPPGSPTSFLLSVAVSKLGHAIAFVLLLRMAGATFQGSWPTYAFIWWLMFAIGEVGQAIGPNYAWKEALAGVVSETAYFPLAAWLVSRF